MTGVLSGLAPGQPLYVEVGGTPTGADSSSCYPSVNCVGGFNGGGSSHYGSGGGGASDVRTAPQAQGGSLDSRRIVAAGGGGGGWSGGCCIEGTPGGDAGRPGGTSSYPGIGTSFGGGPGTQNAGGTAGMPDGEPGTLGTGGHGGGRFGGDGGGGGGGLYGGGGGGDNITNPSTANNTAAGGGGGGSSLVPTGGTLSLSTAPASVTITYLIPQPQMITFPTVADHVYGDPDFEPGARASSGLPVTYASTTPAVCSIVSDEVHILAAGTCTITASQDGDANFAPAQSVSQDITINKAPIAITASARHGLLTTTFTVHVTSTVTGAPVAGEPVTINATNLLGNRFSCTATTNSSGAASCTITSLLGLRSHYTVSVGETANYLPATATE